MWEIVQIWSYFTYHGESVLTVAGADQEEVVKAIENSDFKDFEDCLQDRCAVSVAAEYIVTRNEKDFAVAETKASFLFVIKLP